MTKKKKGLFGSISHGMEAMSEGLAALSHLLEQESSKLELKTRLMALVAKVNSGVINDDFYKADRALSEYQYALLQEGGILEPKGLVSAQKKLEELKLKIKPLQKKNLKKSIEINRLVLEKKTLPIRRIHAAQRIISEKEELIKLEGESAHAELLKKKIKKLQEIIDALEKQRGQVKENFYEGGNLKSIHKTYDAVTDGEVQLYYPNSNIAITARFKKGNFLLLDYFYPDGALALQIKPGRNILTGYYENGNKALEFLKEENNTLVMIFWSSTGYQITSIHRKNGKMRKFRTVCEMLFNASLWNDLKKDKERLGEDSKAIKLLTERFSELAEFIDELASVNENNFKKFAIEDLSKEYTFIDSIFCYK